MITHRACHFESIGNRNRSRFYRAMEPSLLEGFQLPRLYRDEHQTGTLQEFLTFYEFEDVHGGRNHDGWTPLRLAVIEGNIEVVKELLSQRVDIEAPFEKTIEE